MELKAVPAKYEVATQLAKYRDELLSRGKKHILMWLVAPSISNFVREFLDRIGVEYSEIHEAEFRVVAERHGLEPYTELTPQNNRESPAVARSANETPSATPIVNCRLSSRVPYESFKDLMQLAVLPQHAANPGHLRLDG